jgi:ABC-type cobalamin/Fe3+-siderophores transport system ATPase subunit
VISGAFLSTPYFRYITNTYYLKSIGGNHMNVYTSEKIRNVVLLGHGGCGKTTLVEAMAYTTGIIKRQGKVEEGNTISDYDKEEQKRSRNPTF